MRKKPVEYDGVKFTIGALLYGQTEFLIYNNSNEGKDVPELSKKEQLKKLDDRCFEVICTSFNNVEKADAEPDVEKWPAEIIEGPNLSGTWTLARCKKILDRRLMQLLRDDIFSFSGLAYQKVEGGTAGE